MTFHKSTANRHLIDSVHKLWRLKLQVLILLMLQKSGKNNHLVTEINLPTSAGEFTGFLNHQHIVLSNLKRFDHSQLYYAKLVKLIALTQKLCCKTEIKSIPASLYLSKMLPPCFISQNLHVFDPHLDHETFRSTRPKGCLSGELVASQPWSYWRNWIDNHVVGSKIWVNYNNS